MLAWKRSSRWRLTTLGTVLTIVLAGLPVTGTPARADPSAANELTFEEGVAADNATLSDQYYDLYGITFGTATSLALPGGLKGMATGSNVFDCGAAQDTFGQPGRFDTPTTQHHSAGSGTCSGGEFPGPGGFTFSFSDARDTVSLALYDAQNYGAATQSGALVQGYDAAGNLVYESSSTTLAAKTWNAFTLTPGSGDQPIQFVHVQGESDDSVNVDNVSFGAADTTAPAAWSFAASTTSTTVADGSTVDVPITISRRNGSDGDVTISASSTGSLTASLDPDPVSGTDTTATLQVAAPSGAAGQQDQVTLTAGAADAGAGAYDGSPVTIEVTVSAGLQINAVLTPTAPGCAEPVDFGVSVTGYRGTVEVLAGAPPDVTVQGLPAAFVADHDGFYPFSVTLTRNTSDITDFRQATSSPVTFTAEPETPGPAVAKLSASLVTQPPTDVTTATDVTIPDQAQTYPGLPTSVNLNDLRLNLPCGVPFQLAFGNPAATVAATVSTNAEDDTTVSAHVSNLATSGPLELVEASHAGVDVAQIATVDVSEFRQSDTIYSPNVADPDFDWADMENTFGKGNVDDCVFVCVHDPVAELWYDYIAKTLAGGLCFGFSQLAMELKKVDALPSEFVPGATQAGQLHINYYNNAKGFAQLSDPSALANTLVDLSAGQFDDGFVNRSAEMQQKPLNGQQFLAALQADLAKDGMAMISLQSVDGVSGKPAGHAVVADGVDVADNGTLTIHVYNPNNPVGDVTAMTSELSDPTGGQHATRWTNDVITMAPNGSWRFQIGDGPYLLANGTRGPDVWSGTNTAIQLLPYAALPINPQLAASTETGQLLLLLVAGGLFLAGNTPSPVTVGSVTSSGHVALSPAGVVAGRGVSDLVGSTGSVGGPTPTLLGLARGHSYSVTFTGGTSGSYGLGVIGDGLGGGVAKAFTTRGEKDILTLTPGSPAVTFHSTSRKPLQLVVESGRKKGDREALIDLGSAWGTTTVSMSSAGTVTLHRVGPATSLRFELTQGGTAVTTSAMSLPGNGSASVAPDWSKLGSSLHTVITALGHHRSVSLRLRSDSTLHTLLSVTKRAV